MSDDGGDVEQRLDTNALRCTSSSDLELGSDGTVAQNVYFRFVPPAGEGVTLSQSLVEAHIDLSILAESTVLTEVDIRIELSAQSAPLCPCENCQPLSESR